ncbi:MAG TPA: hypothetical protein DCQ28_14615, partial [Bacteroidetes bacterium]|nr:hypothetical protein [Bacteroidota bacterium]
MKSKIVISFLLCTAGLFAQFLTPLEQSNYTQLTINAELVKYIQSVIIQSPWITMDTFAFSVKGKPLPVVTISKGNHKDKIKVLIFAQQHGNEP